MQEYRSRTVLQYCSVKGKSTEVGQCYSAAVLNARVQKWDSEAVLNERSIFLCFIMIGRQETHNLAVGYPLGSPVGEGECNCFTHKVAQKLFLCEQTF